MIGFPDPSKKIEFTSQEAKFLREYLNNGEVHAVGGWEQEALEGLIQKGVMEIPESGRLIGMALCGFPGYSLSTFGKEYVSLHPRPHATYKKNRSV